LSCLLRKKTRTAGRRARMNWNTNLKVVARLASCPQVIPKLPDCKTLPSFDYLQGHAMTLKDKLRHWTKEEIVKYGIRRWKAVPPPRCT
jgi:hypothetical protein